MARPQLRRRGDGLAPTSLVLGAYGFSATPIPLNLLIPQGLPGCNLEISLDLTFGMANAGGTASGSIAIPVIPGRVGASFYQQALQIEVGGSGISAVGSSNGLSYVFGAL